MEIRTLADRLEFPEGPVALAERAASERGASA
jgi:hypothetical protein